MPSRRWRTAVFAATALAFPSCAPPAFHFSEAARRGVAEPYETTQYRFTQGRVPSGLRVVAYEQGGIPNVQVRATWATGGLFPVRQAVRLVTSAVLDQLTPGPRALEPAHRRYALGELFDVASSMDDLVSVSTLKPSMLADAVRIESERMEHPTTGLTEPLLERAKALVAFQIEQAELEPAAQAQLALARSFPGGRPSQLEVTAAQVKEVTLDQVKRFLEAVLRPERAIFVVAGPMDAGATLRTTVDALNAVAFGVKGKEVEPYHALPKPLPVVAQETIRLASAGGSRRMVVSWVLPGTGKDLQSAMLVAKLDLGFQLPIALKAEGQGSEVVPHDIRVMQWDEFSAIQVVLDLKPGADPARTQKAVLSAVSDLGRWGDRWRDRFANRMQEARFAWTRGRVPIDEVARSLRTADEPDPEHAFVAALKRQSSVDLKALLSDFVTPERAGVVLIEPPAGKVAEQAPAGVSNSFEAMQPGPSPLGAAAPGRAAAQRLQFPATLEKARRERLPNGLRVVVVASSAQPFVLVALSLPGGGAVGGEQLRARSALVAFGKALPTACRKVTPAVYTDQVLATMEVQASGVRYALEALSCLRLDQAALVEEAELTPASAQGEVAWNRLRDAGHFASNDWRAGWTERYLRRAFSPEEALLLVVGKVDVDATLAIIRDRFDSWRLPEGPVLAFGEPSRAPERVAVVLDWPGARMAYATVLVPSSLAGASRESLAIAQELPANRMERLAMLNGVKGRASIGELSRGVAGLKLSLEGNAERVAQVIGLALEQGRTVAAAPPAEAELALARWNVARSWLYSDMGLWWTTLDLLELELSGDSPESCGSRGRRLAAVEAEAAFALLRTAQFGHEAVIVSGDQKILVPALEKLGFAPVVIPAQKKDDKK
jgi:hypothetical protein